MAATTVTSASEATIIILNKFSTIAHHSTIKTSSKADTLIWSQAVTSSHSEEVEITEDAVLAQCLMGRLPQKMNLAKATIKQRVSTPKTECEVEEATT